MNRYSLNEDYFAAIDSEEKAYYLGFIAADGCIHSKGTFRICLAVKDRDAVDGLRRAIGYTGVLRQKVYDLGFNPKTGERKPMGSVQVELRFRRERFINHLRRLGLAEVKSGLLAIPSGVPTAIARHYYRGLVDGDGWICSHLNGTRPAWEIGVCGPKASVAGFAEHIFAATGIKMRPRPTGSIWRVSTGGIQYPREVFDVCDGEKDAHERASRLRLKGYRVFGWDMMGAGRFTPKA